MRARLGQWVTESTRLKGALVNVTDQAQDWADTLQRDCADHLHELELLAPWLALEPSTDEERGPLCPRPTLTELDQDASAPATNNYSRSKLSPSDAMNWPRWTLPF